MRRSRRPVLLTRRGRGVAVVLDLEEYARLVERARFIAAVDAAAGTAAEGSSTRTTRRCGCSIRPASGMPGRRRLRWTGAALADRRGIRRHVARERPAAARALAELIRAAVLRLRAFPESGRVVPELEPRGYREPWLRPIASSTRSGVATS